MRPFSYENIYVRVMLYLHVPFFLQGDDLFTYLLWLRQQWMGFFLIGITLLTYHPHYLGTDFLQIINMEMTKNLQCVDMELSTRYHFVYEHFLLWKYILKNLYAPENFRILQFFLQYQITIFWLHGKVLIMI